MGPDGHEARVFETAHPRRGNGQFAQKAQADPGGALLGGSTDEPEGFEADTYTDTTSNYLPAVTTQAGRNPFLTGDKCPICEAPFDGQGRARGCRCYNSPGSVERRAGAAQNPDRKAPSALRSARAAYVGETVFGAAAGVVIAAIPTWAAITGTAPAGDIAGFTVVAVAGIGGLVFFNRSGRRSFVASRDKHRAEVTERRRRDFWQKTSRDQHYSLAYTLAAARTEYLTRVDPDGRIAQFPDGWLDSTQSPAWVKARAAAEAEWRHALPQQPVR